MRAEDKLIGMTIFGWTEDKTEKNNWFDEFFNVWRPKPKDRDDLYPAWSTSGKFAAQLVEELVKMTVEIDVYPKSNGSIEVCLKHDLFEGCGDGRTFPEALSDSVNSIDIYLPAITSLSAVRHALGKE